MPNPAAAASSMGTLRASLCLRAAAAGAEVQSPDVFVLRAGNEAGRSSYGGREFHPPLPEPFPFREPANVVGVMGG